MSKELAPSGTEYEWRKPPRHVHWKHGRAAGAFFARFGQLAQEESGLSDEEKAARLFEGMDEFESERLQAYVDDVVGWGLKPHITDVSTVPEIDYWFIFAKSVYGGNVKIETAEGETDVETVGNFRAESGLSQTGADVQDVSPVPGAADGHIRSFVSG